MKGAKKSAPQPKSQAKLKARNESATKSKKEETKKLAKGDKARKGITLSSKSNSLYHSRDREDSQGQVGQGGE